MGLPKLIEARKVPEGAKKEDTCAWLGVDISAKLNKATAAKDDRKERINVGMSTLNIKEVVSQTKVLCEKTLFEKSLWKALSPLWRKPFRIPCGN